MDKSTLHTLSDEEKQVEYVCDLYANPSLSSTSTVVESDEWWFKRYLWEDVDPNKSTIPLTGYCFMTGFVDTISIVSVTSNTIDIAVALARAFTPARLKHPSGSAFATFDSQSLVSLLSFLLGAFLGRIGDYMGARTRAWLCVGTLWQSFCSMATAILLQSNKSITAWTNANGYAALAFSSGSMGLQGIMAKRLDTTFSTTIVLTTIWCELMADPTLFCRRLVKNRDTKIIAVSALFCGGVVAQVLTDVVDRPTTFAIGAGFRIVIAFLWLRVPSKHGTTKETL